MRIDRFRLEREARQARAREMGRLMEIALRWMVSRVKITGSCPEPARNPRTASLATPNA